jgi:peptidyl-prolyl cis-trans isomerase D
MLKVFRENLKALSWALWIVLIMLVLSIFVTYGMNNQGGPDNSQAAATVDGHVITLRQWQQTAQEQESQLRQMYGEQFSPEVAKQFQIPQRAIAQLVNQRLLLTEAERLGLQVTDEELRQLLLEQLTGPDGKVLTKDQYRQVVRQQGYSSPARFEQSLREELLRAKLQTTLKQTVSVTDAEVEESYREQMDRAAIRFVQVPRVQFAADVRIEPAEIAQRFESTKDQFKLPEQRVIEYVLVDKVLLRNQLEVPEADLMAYYQSHQDDLKSPERVHARHILIKTETRTADEARAILEEAKRKVEAGQDFAALARELSEDAASKAQGGDLGYFPKGRMTPEFEQPAFATPAGQLAGPVSSPFGLHLIQVLDHQPEGVPPFEQVKSLVRARAAAERVEGAAATLAQELLVKLGTEPVTSDKLKALPAGNQAVRYAESKAFSKAENLPALGRTTELNEAVFGMTVGTLAPTPLTTGRGPALVFLKEVKPPRVPELSEVQAQVRGKIEAERQQSLAEQAMARAKAEVLAGKSLDDVAAELGVAVQDSGEFAKNGSIQGLGFDKPVIDAAFKGQAGELVGPVKSTQGAVLLRITERKGFNAIEFNQEKDSLRDRLESEKLNQLVGSLIQSRRQEAKIDYNSAFAEQLGVVAN